MAIKVKNGEIPSMIGALDQLSMEKLPVKGALKVRKAVRSLRSTWDIIDDVRKKLLDEHAEKDADGKNVPGEPLPNGQMTTKLDESKRAAFHAAWVELLEQESEVVDTLTAEDLGTREVSPALLIQLGDLLTD